MVRVITRYSLFFVFVLVIGISHCQVISTMPALTFSVQNYKHQALYGIGGTVLLMQDDNNPNDWLFHLHDINFDYLWNRDLSTYSVGYSRSISKVLFQNMVLIGVSFQRNKFKHVDVSEDSYNSITPEASFQLYTIVTLRLGYQFSLDSKFDDQNQFKIKFLISPSTILYLWLTDDSITKSKYKFKK